MRIDAGLLAAGLLAWVLTPQAEAQWGSDSLQNLEICDLTGEQVTPKIAGTSDGGCFISWFDSRSGDYCMYIQRLDSLGNAVFNPGGLLVSDHAQQSWLVDYDLDVDGNDNAVLAFCDIRYTGDLDVTAYMIGSDGSFLWGPDGICLSDTALTGFEPAPSVAVTEDGNCVFAWGFSDAEYYLVYQKVSPAGEKLWGDWGITYTSGSSDLSSPLVVPAGQDSVITMWKSSTGVFPAQVTWLYAQELDVDGDFVWGDTEILVYNGGAITPWDYPELQSDGSGGAICSWYDAPSLSEFNVWIQRFDADGNMLFPMNGAQASTNSDNRLHMYPSAVYYPVEDKTYAFWVEENDNQDQFGLYAQAFSPTGDRLWTDSGLELLPLGSDQIFFVRALSNSDGIYAGYLTGSVDTALRVMRTGYDGSVIWGPVTLSAASLGGKDDLYGCTWPWGGAVYTWCDYRNDFGIYAQNVNPDGSMGPGTGIGEGPVSHPGTWLSVSPNPSPGGASIAFTIGEGCRVSLGMYDISGRLLRTLVSGTLDEGSHTVLLNADDAPGAGIYFLRLEAGGTETTASMVIL
jgi:hypothetical protein